jgi:AmmeMemoRadiSam system protein B
MIREPVVSGVFYPSDKKRLLKELESFIKPKEKQENVKMII